MINRRLFNLVPKTKQLIFKVVLFQWLSLLCNIVFLLNIKRIVDQKADSLELWIITQVILIVLKIIFVSISKHYSVKTSNTVKSYLRIKLYQHLLHLGAKYQEHIASSTIAQLVSEGVEQLEVYFALYLPQLFYAMFAPLSLFVFLSFYNLKVAFILFVLVPLIPVSIVFVQKFAKRILNRYWGSYTNLSSSFLDSLQGLSTLKAFNMDEMMHQQINEESESFRKATMRVLVMQLNSISVMDLVAYGGAMLAIVMAYKQYSMNHLSLGTFLMFVLISSEFFIPMRLLGSYFHIAMNGVAAADRIFEFLELKKDAKTTVQDVKCQRIYAKDMDFSYGTKKVLHDINFEINQHEFVAFVGESGSGKSTLLALLSKHLEADSLFVDQHDIKTIQSDVYYQNVVLVSSKSYLFKGSVRFNLNMAQSHDDDVLIEMLRKVDLWDMFKTRDGLDTEILERGSNLSGGEKQRLILARALLFDAKVYLFDEVTSNVDVESEAVIMDVILGLENKIIVMVSHRLKNIEYANKIYVLEKGSIVESGNHQQLLKNKGTYYQSYQTQKALERVVEV